MTNPAPYTVYRLPDGRHVRTRGAARLIEGEGEGRTVRVHPVEGVPSIGGETMIPMGDLIVVAPDDQWSPPEEG